VSVEEPRAAGLSVEERLALVDAVERREAGAVRKAAAVAWMSVAVAAVLLGLLVFGAWWQVQRIRGDVAALNAQRESLVARIETQKADVARLDAEYRDKQAALSTLIGAVRRTDDSARGGLETALDADPKSTTLVPRAYIQIADAGDQQWAKNLGDRFQNAGVIPVGVELVPTTSAPDVFEVRYYKKAEEPGAQRILTVMENSGVPQTKLVYLNLENNTRVRRNHFEVWCPANARQHKLRPIAPPAPPS
jgi:hypothetical protein